MKSNVRNWLLTCALLGLSQEWAAAQCQCKCRPSPPGGTTECSRGQIAVCGAGENGTCHGSCISLSNGEAKDSFGDVGVAVNLMEQVLHVSITSAEVQENRDEFASALDKLIGSSKSDQPVHIEFKQRVFTGNIGLSDKSADQLRKARRELLGGPMAEVRQQ